MKHRCTGQRVTPTASQDYYCNSPPANQEAELPWGAVELSESESESDHDDGWIITTPPHYYDDVDEEAIASSPAHEDDNDEDFTYSPASPPLLTQSTEAEKTPTSAPTTLYVFPMKTIVLKPDGECEYIADQYTITHPKPSTSTITHPKPSTSTVEDDATDAEEDPRKVCFLEMQNNIAGVIAAEWRASAPSTVEEVTVDVCRSLAVTILSAPYQEILMKYVRCAIRRQP